MLLVFLQPVHKQELSSHTPVIIFKIEIKILIFLLVLNVILMKQVLITHIHDLMGPQLAQGKRQQILIHTLSLLHTSFQPISNYFTYILDVDAGPMINQAG